MGRRTDDEETELTDEPRNCDRCQLPLPEDAHPNRKKPCKLWNGAVSPEGYGKYSRAYIHRVVYEEEIGSLPAGYDIDHLCRNRLCYEPTHLEAVTRAENIRRGAGSGGALYERPTTCKQGHEYTVENTYEHGSKRWCVTCRRERRGVKNVRGTYARV